MKTSSFVTKTFELPQYSAWLISPLPPKAKINSGPWLGSAKTSSTQDTLHGSAIGPSLPGLPQSATL
jgi:hypothetical protein